MTSIQDLRPLRVNMDNPQFEAGQLHEDQSVNSEKININQEISKGFDQDTHGVSDSVYKPYGRNELPNTFKGQFINEPIQDHRWNFRKNYNTDLIMRTLSEPSNPVKYECPNEKVGKAEIYEGNRLAVQDGWKRMNYPNGPMQAIHGPPHVRTAEKKPFGINKETLSTVADMSRYGKQKPIKNSIPPLHEGQVFAPRDITVIKMGNEDMENVIQGPKLGHYGNNRIYSGRYAGTNGNYFEPVF